MQIELNKNLSANLFRRLNYFIKSFSTLNPQYYVEWNTVFNKMGITYEYIIAYNKRDIFGFLPFAKKNTTYGTVIHSSPFIGYGGPVAKNNEIKSMLIKYLIDYAKKNKYLTVTICTPALFQQEEIDVYKTSMNYNYKSDNFYQYSLLDKHPLTKLKSKRKSAFKNEIKKCFDLGITLEYETNKELLNRWFQIYKNRYDEIGAAPYPQHFFELVFDELIMNNKAKLVTAFKNEKLIGGVLFLLGKNIVDYFSSAFESEYNKYYPTTYLLNICFDFFIEHNFKYFNWQSSPDKTGVFNYKARWGALEDQHFYFTSVTGDLSNILSTPLEIIREVFEGFYILPFDLWNKN